MLPAWSTGGLPDGPAEGDACGAAFWDADWDRCAERGVNHGTVPSVEKSMMNLPEAGLFRRDGEKCCSRLAHERRPVRPRRRAPHRPLPSEFGGRIRLARAEVDKHVRG